MIDLDRLQARVDNATPGPWVATEPNLWGDDYDILQSGVDVPGGSLTWDDHSGEVFKPEDAQFIAEAHQAVPELIRMVKELSQENEHLRAKYDEDMEQLRLENDGNVEVSRLRHKVFTTVLDFLDEHYDCDCPRADPDGSNTAEALNLAELVMSVMHGDDMRKPDSSAEDIDSNALRRYLNNRRLAAKVYAETAKRLGRDVPEKVQTYLKEEDTP